MHKLRRWQLCGTNRQFGVHVMSSKLFLSEWQQCVDCVSVQRRIQWSEWGNLLCVRGRVLQSYCWFGSLYSVWGEYIQSEQCFNFGDILFGVPGEFNFCGGEQCVSV